MDSNRYVRSRSNPKFYRMKSKNNYIRDNSKFKRSMSRSSKSQERSKLIKRPKSELFKKVEEIERKMEKVEKVERSVDDIMEMLKKRPINMKFVEEEIVVDIKFVDTRKGTRMIVDSGAPLSLVSLSWLKSYQEENQVDDR